VNQPEKDIETRDDIVLLLEAFYKKILADDSINYIFTDVAQMNIEEHIPVITDFWESVLFQTGTYRKNAVGIHLDLHRKSPLTKEHFQTWLRYFNESVDSLFSGNNSFAIKQKANSIATIMQIKIQQVSA